MAITIQDVAALAGVSPSTVSRVLNNNRDISAETVATVQKAIQQLGYRRSATPRGRRPSVRASDDKKFAALALLIPDIHIEAMLTPLTGQLVHGAEAVTRAHNQNFLFTRLDADGSLPPCLAPVQVDGLIVRSGGSDTQTVFPAIPTVWVFKSVRVHTYGDLVCPDNEAIGHMAADYLKQRGSTRFAVLNAIVGHAEARIRRDSFLQSLRLAGITNPQGLDAPTTNLDEALDTLLNAFSLKPNSDPEERLGLFLPIGDRYLEAVCLRLEQRGFRVGENVTIISCNNDISHLRVIDRQLPNIDIRADEIGRMAAETLLWRIEHPNEHRRTVLIEPQLVEG